MPDLTYTHITGRIRSNVGGPNGEHVYADGGAVTFEPLFKGQRDAPDLVALETRTASIGADGRIDVWLIRPDVPADRATYKVTIAARLGINRLGGFRSFGIATDADEIDLFDVAWIETTEGVYLPPPMSGGGGGGGPVAWGDVTGKPSTFPPSAHAHVVADVAGLQGALDGKETPAGAQAKVDAERGRALAVEAAKADLVGGKVPTDQIAAISTHETITVASEAARLALTTEQVQPGDEAIVSGGTSAQRGRWLLLAANPSQAGSWLRLSAPGGVQSVNGQTVADIVLGAADVGATAAAHATDQTNPHAVTKSQVGLGNVDNTSDANKPVSTAQAAALDGKAATARGLPPGGTTGQRLQKKSGTDYDTEWVNAGAALPTLTAVLASDLSTPASATSDVLSLTLPVGTWLVTANVTAVPSATAQADILLTVGTATATISGVQAQALRAATAAVAFSTSLTSVVTVTAAGTMLVQIAANNAGHTIKATSTIAGRSPATGVTALKVA